MTVSIFIYSMAYLSAFAYIYSETDINFLRTLFEAMMKEIVNSFVIEDDIQVLITLVQSLTMV